MLESLPSYILFFFILGASFAFGIWSFLVLAARFLPTPSFFGNSLVSPPSVIETAKHLPIKMIELRDGKIFVGIFNSSHHTYTDLLFRVTARDEEGNLIEDVTCVAHGFARPQAEFDCLLQPCRPSERWRNFDSDNLIKVELIHAGTT